MPELLTALAIFGHRDQGDFVRRIVRRDHQWRLGIYEALAARYDLGQSFASTMRRMADRRRGTAPTAKRTLIIKDWADRLADGAELSKVLEGWIPDDELMIIAASETDVGLNNAVWLLERKLNQLGTLKDLLIYPATLMFMIIILMLIVGYKILPLLLTIQMQHGIHSNTLFMWICMHAYLMPVPFACIYMLLRRSLPLWDGNTRIKFDMTVPIWTHYRKHHGLSFLISYVAMWSSGMTELQTLRALASRVTNNRWLEARILAIADRVEDGQSPGEALETTGYGFPDPAINETIADMETEPEQMIIRLKTLTLREGEKLDKSLKTFSTLMNPILLGIVALIIVTIATSVFSAFNVDGMLSVLNGAAPLPH